MASREPTTITLGDAAFEIRPLTVNQVERIDEVLAEAKTMRATAMARHVIGIALSRDHNEVDVGEVECGVQDLAVAMAEIFRHGGFMNAAPGEATAAA